MVPCPWLQISDSCELLYFGCLEGDGLCKGYASVRQTGGRGSAIITKHVASCKMRYSSSKEKGFFNLRARSRVIAMVWMHHIHGFGYIDM